MSIPPIYKLLPLPEFDHSIHLCFFGPTLDPIAARLLNFDLLTRYTSLSYNNFEEQFVKELNCKDCNFYLHQLKEFTPLPGFEGDKVRGIPRVLALMIMYADLKCVDRSQLKTYLDVKFPDVQLPILWNLITKTPTQLQCSDVDYLRLLDKIILLNETHLFCEPIAKMYSYLSRACKIDYLQRIAGLDSAIQSKIFEKMPPEFGSPYIEIKDEWVVINESIPKEYVEVLTYLPLKGIKHVQIQLSQNEELDQFSEPSATLGKRQCVTDTRTKKQSRLDVSGLLKQLNIEMEVLDLHEIRHLDFQEIYPQLARFSRLQTLCINPLNAHLETLLQLTNLYDIHLTLPFHERNHPDYIQNLQNFLPLLRSEVQLVYDVTDEWKIIDLIPILQLCPRYCPRYIVNSKELLRLATFVPNLEELRIGKEARLETFPFFPKLKILDIEEGSSYDLKSFEATYTGTEFNIRIESLSSFSNLLTKERDLFVLNSLLRNLHNTELFLLDLSENEFDETLIAGLQEHPDYSNIARYLLVKGLFNQWTEFKIQSITNAISHNIQNYEYLKIIEDILLSVEREDLEHFFNSAKEHCPLIYVYFNDNADIRGTIQQLKSFELEYSQHMPLLMNYLKDETNFTIVRGIAKLFYELHKKHRVDFDVEQADQMIKFLSRRQEVGPILDVTFEHAPEYFINSTLDILCSSKQRHLVFKTMVKSENFNENLANSLIFKIFELTNLTPTELESIESLFKPYIHKFELKELTTICSPSLAVLVGQMLIESYHPLNFELTLSVILKLCLEEIDSELTTSLLLKLSKKTVPLCPSLLKFISNPIVAAKIMKAIVNNIARYEVFSNYLSDLLEACVGIGNDDLIFEFIEDSPKPIKFQSSIIPIICSSLPKILNNILTNNFCDRNFECLVYLAKCNTALNPAQQQTYFLIKKKLPQEDCSNLTESAAFLINNREYFLKWLTYFRKRFSATEKISDPNLVSLLVASLTVFDSLPPESTRDQTIKDIFRVIDERRTYIPLNEASKILLYISNVPFHYRIINSLFPQFLNPEFISKLSDRNKELLGDFLIRVHLTSDGRMDKRLLALKLEKEPEILDFMIFKLVRDHQVLPEHHMRFAIQNRLLENVEYRSIILQKLSELGQSKDKWEKVENFTPFESFKIILNSFSLPESFSRKLYSTNLSELCFESPNQAGSLVDIQITESQNSISLNRLCQIFKAANYNALTLQNIQTFIDEVEGNLGVLGAPGEQEERAIFYDSIKKALKVIIDQLEKQPFNEREFCLVTLANGCNMCGTGKLSAVKACYSYISGQMVLDEQLSVKEKLIQAIYQIRHDIFQKLWIKYQPQLTVDSEANEVHYYLLLRELAQNSSLKLDVEVPYKDRIAAIPYNIKKSAETELNCCFSPKKLIDALFINFPLKYEEIYDCLVSYYFKNHTAQSYHPGGPIPEEVREALSNAFDTESTGNITKEGLMDLLISQGFLLT